MTQQLFGAVVLAIMGLGLSLGMILIIAGAEEYRDWRLRARQRREARESFPTARLVLRAPPGKDP